MVTTFDRFFQISARQSTIGREVVAGLTTFVTMAYIVIVNPAILSAAGIPKGPSTTATILSAVFGTLLMGLYAKRPFAIAPYMGENAFIAFTVVKIMGFSWETALGAVFIGGVLFTILTLSGSRRWFAKVIPPGLKLAFGAGIGLFLTLIGLVDTGIVRLGVIGAPVQIGVLSEPQVALAISGLILIAILMKRKVPGGILAGIFLIALTGWVLGLAPLPEKVFSAPAPLTDIWFKIDLKGALSWGFFSVLLTVFIMDFVDTMAALIGLGAQADLLDQDGNLPDIDKPLLADALATVVGALLGTTTTGTYIESAAGIEAGGRTGLTAVVTAAALLLCLFFAPLLTSIPAFAYGPALILVGGMMMSLVAKIDFTDYNEWIPAFITIALMSFTYNLGIGITAGFIFHTIMQIGSGRAARIHPGMWLLAGVSLLFFMCFPYQ
ncbi:MAG: NCS2 family permease [Deltaproteobacteria bacterium]|nr:NCS2 family permease [Deltaproteobacteria bacterium]